MKQYILNGSEYGQGLFVFSDHFLIWPLKTKALKSLNLSAFVFI
jgi:hypothetical protein